MDRIPIETGRVVLSKAGRDAGRCFVVLHTDDAFAYVADGDLRKVEKPKKKKHMHLRALPMRSEEIADAVRGGRSPSNADIRKVLADKP